MENYLLPIIGEVNNTEMVMLIMSLTTVTLNFYNSSSERQIFIFQKQIEKYTVNRFVLNRKKYILEDIGKFMLISQFNPEENLNFAYDISNNSKFAIVNCDCQFVLETGLWEEVYNENPSRVFHIGDQIYMDLIFIQQYRRNEIKYKPFFMEYFNTFYRKRHVLRSSSNMMIGDDHEIVDSDYGTTLQNNNTYKELKSISINLYKDIQLGLLLTEHKNDFYIRTYDDILFVFVGRTLRKQSKLFFDTTIHNEILKKYTNQKNVVFLMSVPPFKTNPSNLEKVVYKLSDEDFNFTKFYNLVEIMKKNESNISIISGDSHTQMQGYLCNNKQEVIAEVFNAGAITSVLDYISPTDYYYYDEKYTLTTTYVTKTHGYVIINNKFIILKTPFKILKIFSWLSPIIFAIKYFKAKYI